MKNLLSIYFFFCEVTELFWKEILSWLARCRGQVVDLSIADVLFGKFDRDIDFMVINNLFLLAKLIIYLFFYYIHMILLLLAIYILTKEKKKQLHSLLWLAYIHYILQSTEKSNICTALSYKFLVN